MQLLYTYGKLMVPIFLIGPLIARLDHVTILKQKLWHTSTALKMPQMERARENKPEGQF